MKAGDTIVILATQDELRSYGIFTSVKQYGYYEVLNVDLKNQYIIFKEPLLQGGRSTWVIPINRVISSFIFETKLYKALNGECDEI